VENHQTKTCTQGLDGVKNNPARESGLTTAKTVNPELRPLEKTDEHHNNMNNLRFFT